ncbi:MAG TPA: YlxR family protein [Gaiellaceae bacterium]|nr:YlxR family protein [Gaiellaceae bacterium]
MAEPLRRCAGCGRHAPQQELVRFAAKDGELVPAPVAGTRELPGRGVYTCGRLECFERARAQRGFARVLRQGVRVDPALARLYTGD